MGLTKLFVCLAAGLLFGSIARADVNQAIQGCISQADQNLSKSRTVDSSDTTIGISCRGEWARYLFDQVQHYGHQSPVREDDSHNTIIVRYFGTLTVPSQCIHIIQDAYGNGVDRYRCYLQIDLNSAITKAI